MKRLSLIVALFASLVSIVQAAKSPDQLVRETADQVISELTANREALENNPEELYRMVNEIVLPRFDFERMARYVLGRSWNDASDQQKQAFIKEFRTLLVRTYATALFEYTGQEIVYKPFHMDEGDRRAVVKTEVQPADGPAIPIEYALLQSDGEWKVYDVRIDGLSLVTNYRSQYGRILERQGMDALINQLADRNKRLMSGQ